MDWGLGREASVGREKKIENKIKNRNFKMAAPLSFGKIDCFTEIEAIDYKIQVFLFYGYFVVCIWRNFF